MELDVAFFDMDFTVLAVDCEQTWKGLLVDHGICAEEVRALAQRYIDLHAIGKTPRDEYIAFLLKDLVDRTPAELEPLARKNFEKHIRHKIYPDAVQTINRYHEKGIPTVLLSGSIRPLVEPISKHLGVSDVICTELAIHAGRFTGIVDGLYRIEEHKVSGAVDWCRTNGTAPSRAAFYGDSMSDIPMFEIVSHPYVVNPSDTLDTMASERGWEILHWGIKNG